MKKETLLKILNSNVELTNDELLELMQTPEPEPETALVSDPEPEPEPAPASDPEPTDYDAVIKNAIAAGFKDLTAALQAAEISRSRLPEQNDDDILAQIIAPPMKERESK